MESGKRKSRPATLEDANKTKLQQSVPETKHAHVSLPTQLLHPRCQIQHNVNSFHPETGSVVIKHDGVGKGQGLGVREVGLCPRPNPPEPPPAAKLPLRILPGQDERPASGQRSEGSRRRREQSRRGSQRDWGSRTSGKGRKGQRAAEEGEKWEAGDRRERAEARRGGRGGGRGERKSLWQGQAAVAEGARGRRPGLDGPAQAASAGGRRGST